MPDTPATAPRQVLILGFASLAIVLAGCSGGVSESVATAAQDSSSAVATARIALRQDMDGKLTRAATSTTLDDALKEVDTSRSTVLKLSAATREDRDIQRQALEVLERCAAGLTAARAAVAADDGGTAPSTADADRALAAAEDALQQLEDKVAGK
ncbi:hypothetical protein [Pseudarthrobacter chlorophenolicus]|uniref:hypothetical protein n=1 Tax=Pseudarthrobacter chlorophenolicus TaxID=85085 RepID=UPI0005F2E9C3|nr:hypothetical protein [Pseudarthrobacter chlorophenolicus]